MHPKNGLINKKLSCYYSLMVPLVNSTPCVCGGGFLLGMNFVDKELLHKKKIILFEFVQFHLS